MQQTSNPPFVNTAVHGPLQCSMFVGGSIETMKRKIAAEMGIDEDAILRLWYDKVEGISANYGVKLEVRAPNYSDQLTCLAYLFMYMTFDAELIKYLLGLNNELATFLANLPVVKLACIGGGPGSDLLGVSSYLARLKNKQNLSALNLDREVQWGPFWSDFIGRLSRIFPALQGSKLTHFDARSTRMPTDGFNGVHLITCSMMMTELWSCKEESYANIIRLFGSAPEGCYALIVDNNIDFFQWIDAVGKQSGMTCVKGDTIEQKFGVPGGMQDFDRYLALFRRFTQEPKKPRWNTSGRYDDPTIPALAYRIWRKDRPAHI